MNNDIQLPAEYVNRVVNLLNEKASFAGIGSVVPLAPGEHLTAGKLDTIRRCFLDTAERYVHETPIQRRFGTAFLPADGYSGGEMMWRTKEPDIEIIKWHGYEPFRSAPIGDGISLRLAIGADYSEAETYNPADNDAYRVAYPPLQETAPESKCVACDYTPPVQWRALLDQIEAVSETLEWRSTKFEVVQNVKTMQWQDDGWVLQSENTYTTTENQNPGWALLRNYSRLDYSTNHYNGEWNMRRQFHTLTKDCVAYRNTHAFPIVLRVLSYRHPSPVSYYSNIQSDYGECEFDYTIPHTYTTSNHNGLYRAPDQNAHGRAIWESLQFRGIKSTDYLLQPGETQFVGYTDYNHYNVETTLQDVDTYARAQYFALEAPLLFNTTSIIEGGQEMIVFLQWKRA